MPQGRKRTSTAMATTAKRPRRAPIKRQRDTDDSHVHFTKRARIESKTYVSSSDLAIYTLPPIDPTKVDTYEVSYRPLTTFSTGSDLQYKVKGDNEDFIKPFETTFGFGIQICEEDGITPINEYHKVGPINNSGHSFIDKIGVIFNNQSVSSSNKYSQRSYMSNTLNYTSDAINSHLANSLYVKDAPANMDSTLNDTDNPNPGLVKRSEYFKKGKIHYFDIHLDCDIFNCDRLIPNQVDLQITITPSKPEYCLMAGSQMTRPILSQANKNTLKSLEIATQHAQHNVDNAKAAVETSPDDDRLKQLLNQAKSQLKQAQNAYDAQREEYATETDVPPKFTFRFVEPTLWITKQKLLPSVLMGQARAIEITTAKFPITRVTTRSFAISEGVQTFTIDNAAVGQLPKRISYVLIDMEAYSGSYKKNPLRWQHFDIKQTSIMVNGKCIPLIPFTPDFSSENFCREYQHLFKSVGIGRSNLGIIITKEAFKNGTTVFIYDLTQNNSASDSSHTNIIKQGDIRIDLQFKKQLPKAIVCLVFCEYDNLIEIDHDRNIYLDYNPV